MNISCKRSGLVPEEAGRGQVHKTGERADKQVRKRTEREQKILS